MIKKLNILNSNFKENNPLQQGIAHPFTLPKNYFDGFSSSIINKILLEEKSIHKSNQPDYFIPDGYFNKLSELIFKETQQILEEVITDELTRIAPVFKNISKENVYQVPVGYFEKAIEKEESSSAKVFSIKNKQIVRWIIAASLIGIMLIGAFLVTDRDSNNGVTPKNLAYSKKNIDLNSSIKKISDDDLTKYLNNDYNTYNSDQVILDDGVVPDLVDKKIEAVSDDDLNKYLSDAATSTNIKKGL